MGSIIPALPGSCGVGNARFVDPADVIDDEGGSARAERIAGPIRISIDSSDSDYGELKRHLLFLSSMLER